jgi:SsrA-binding protein
MPTKMVTRNRKAFHDYEILERFEAGIELVGTEVKSIRAGRINLLDSYATCQDGELYVHHIHISPFEQGSLFNHDPYRKRKLLLHRRQIGHLCGEVSRKPLTIVPLAVYFEKQWVKLEIGLARGRKKYDKRQKINKEESKKQLAALNRAARR